MKSIALFSRTKTLQTVYVVVDDDDFERLNAFSWRSDARGYAVRSEAQEGRAITIYMHREIMGLARGDRRIVDHRDGIRLHNCKSNLRVCTHSQNNANAQIQRNNKTGFKGVVYVPSRRKYRAYIGHQGKNKNLGSYETAEEAYEVYCLWADMLHGEFAYCGTPRVLKAAA
jgi:hypothetical protein